MNQIYTWRIIPSSSPAVRRYCPKCGCLSDYVTTSCFRVNANSNQLDVWLVYQCSKCKSTWNMDILSRVNRNQIDRELYDKFLRNDPELARQYAFDTACHSRNKSVLSYKNIDYEISECRLSPEILKEGFQLELLCDYPLEIRLDQLLCRQLSISREQIKKLCRSGKIKCEGIKDVSKAKLKSGMVLTIDKLIDFQKRMNGPFIYGKVPCL